MSYVGIGTGITGAITGIFGAVVAYLNHREVHKIRTLDLHLKLRTSLDSLHADLSDLPGLIGKADTSRERVANATGGTNSGNMKYWKGEVAADSAQLAELRYRAPKADIKFDRLSNEELESKLVEWNRVQVQVDKLKAKYAATLKER